MSSPRPHTARMAVSHAARMAARPAPRLALALLVALACLASTALAHQTIRVGSGADAYDMVFGFSREPVFTDERNSLDLIVRGAADRAGVSGLEPSLNATITSPDGQSTYTFTLRGQFGRPGAYTDDVILTAPGVYTIRVWGFVGGIEVDVQFESHEVRSLATLRFP